MNTQKLVKTSIKVLVIYYLIATPIAIVFVVFLLSSCSSSSKEESNKAPVVSAGEDRTIFEDSTILLEGSASDPDGSIKSLEWLSVQGITVTPIENADTLTATFTAPSYRDMEAFDYIQIIAFIATDNDGAATEDKVTFTIVEMSTMSTSLGTSDTLSGIYYDPQTDVIDCYREADNGNVWASGHIFAHTPFSFLHKVKPSM